MEEQKNTAIDDIKALKGYILGVIGFATGVSGFCTLALGWDGGKVAAVSAVAATVSITLGFLIQRSENRQTEAMKKHNAETAVWMNKYDETLGDIKGMLVENHRSSIRLEMNSFIRNDPSNHDTILAYAEKYFCELNGDWKETDVFLSWVDRENEAGRKVHVPPELFSNVHAKRQAEIANNR